MDQLTEDKPEPQEVHAKCVHIIPIPKENYHELPLRFKNCYVCGKPTTHIEASVITDAGMAIMHYPEPDSMRFASELRAIMKTNFEVPVCFDHVIRLDKQEAAKD